MDVGEREIHDCPAPVDGRYLLDDLEFIVPVVVLREVYQEARSPIIHSDVDSWEFIQPSVVVPDRD